VMWFVLLLKAILLRLSMLYEKVSMITNINM